jgi:hypothetical protein
MKSTSEAIPHNSGMTKPSVRSSAQPDLNASERLLNEANSRPRVNWPGVFAGVITGVAVQLVLTFLGVAIGAGAVSDAGGLAVSALVWTALSLIVSAFLAGYTAVRAGNQELATRGQFTGLITGFLLLLATSLVVGNTLLGAARGASSVVSSVVGGAASATAAAGSAAAGDPATQNAAQSLLGSLNADSIGQIIGDASPELSEAQSTAAAKVVSGIITRASNDLGKNLGDVTNLRDFVTGRVNSIQAALSGPQFVTRLQRQGLSQAQAQATQTAIVAQAKQVQQQAADTAAAAERIARKTASTAAWGSLLAAGLIIGLSVLGGNQAASTRRKITGEAQRG